VSRLLFDNIPDAKSLLELRREELAGYIMEHLQTLGGNPLKEQNSHPNNLAISIVGHYPQSVRDKVHTAIFSTCKWLIKKDYLAETNDQGFYEISEQGSLIKIAADLTRIMSAVPQSDVPLAAPQSNISTVDQSPKVFISYSWKDKPLVLALEDKLRTAGAEVWVDHRGIRAGDNLPDEISNALKWCNTLLLIWSSSSVDSDWVKDEWTSALSLRKRIIPCLVDDTQLPSILSHKAYIRMSNVVEGTAQLLRALPPGKRLDETDEQVKQINGQHLVPEKENERDSMRLAKHPNGLAPLCLFEFGERFSYYGVRAILILYMIAPLAEGGLGFDTHYAGLVYTSYALAIYFLSLPGGLIADYLLGSRRAVLIGGILVACGDLIMTRSSVNTFYAGMILMAFGTGLLKPNITSMVGSLYPKNDLRRDSGFTIFHMSVTIGAFLAPVVFGYLALGERFQGYVDFLGFNVWASWRLAFGLAGLGMTFGLVILLLNRGRLADVGLRIKKSEEREQVGNRQFLQREDWKRIAAILIVFVFAIIYWWALEQSGSLLSSAEGLNRSETSGFHFPEPLGGRGSAGLITLLVIILAPMFSILWVRLRERQPSSFGKLSLGLLITSVAYLLLIPALSLTGIGKISQIWLGGVYLLEVAGELCIVPVALNIVTKLAPERLASTMVALWFLTIMFGSILVGRIGSELFTSSDSWALVNLYGVIAAVLLASGLILAAITPSMKRLIGPLK
jgi:POT family proton-dependent oligopeptide transporter